MRSMLSVEMLEAWYGESKALHGVTFNIHSGELITLLGRNGAGKTTTLKSIMGMVPRRAGSVQHEGMELITNRSYSIARRGIAFCPEERGIFASLSVVENLLLPPPVAPGGMTETEILELFPNLRERMWTNQGSKLSGGEQQMLALARILRTGAKLLLLDEPTEGLAPIIVNQIGASIHKMKSLGYTIILVEQNINFVRDLADRHYVLENGRIVDEIHAREFGEKTRDMRKYLSA